METPRRFIRVGDDIWRAAGKRAKHDDVTLLRADPALADRLRRRRAAHRPTRERGGACALAINQLEEVLADVEG